MITAEIEILSHRVLTECDVNERQQQHRFVYITLLEQAASDAASYSHLDLNCQTHCLCIPVARVESAPSVQTNKLTFNASYIYSTSQAYFGLILKETLGVSSVHIVLYSISLCACKISAE